MRRMLGEASRAIHVRCFPGHADFPLRAEVWPQAQAEGTWPEYLEAGGLVGCATTIGMLISWAGVWDDSTEDVRVRASRMSLPFHVYTCDWEGKCWLPWPHVTQAVHDALSKRRQAQVISMYRAIVRMQDVPAEECHVRLEKLQQERGLSIKQLYVEAVSFLKYRIQLLVMCRAPLLHVICSTATGCRLCKACLDIAERTVELEAQTQP